MCGHNRHRPIQDCSASTSKTLEAGFYPYESSPHTSTGSSFFPSFPSFGPSSRSSQAASVGKKKRRWYKPKLRINLHPDWMWVGFIRAGHTTPTGQCCFRNGGQDDDEGWEQLPAYTPPREDGPDLVRRFDVDRTDEQDEWLVEPSSTGASEARRDRCGLEPPGYR